MHSRRSDVQCRATIFGVLSMLSTPVKFADDLELDWRAYELRRSGQPIRLSRIPMELLFLLVERRGELVTRNEIVARIWGKDVFLDTDNSINAAVRKLRQVLDDDPEHPRYLQTVTGMGYRFIAPVVEVSPPEASPATLKEQGPEAGNLVGKKVSHYRILQVLGGGGMGVVYKAEDLKLGRKVAIKFLPAELASDPNAFERLEREARAASALEHPNICPIYELGEHEGQPFIVMQLLEGQTLQERIETAGQQKKPLPTSEVLDLALQIVAGLEAAHAKGIIHRDVKPANILVTKSGEVKILDFGLAKIVEQDVVQNQTPEQVALSETSVANAPTATFSNLRLTRTGTTVGTAYYMSPEQVRGETLDARTDVFSFGLVLYEMATGERAFPGNTVAVVQDAILHREALPAQRTNPQLSVELERTISKALEKDCNLRYQHAADMRADLLRLKRDTDSAKLLLVNTGSPVRSGWRLHQSAMAAGVLLVVLILAGVLYIRRSTPSTQIREVSASHRQVTFRGDTYEPAISPDGMFVAYVVRKHGEDNQLMVQAPNGSTLELTRGPFLAGPLWSPDGSDLVFIGNDRSAEATPHVFLISRLGGVARKFGAATNACWSPDGAGIVTGSSGEREPGLSLVDKLSGQVKHISLPRYTWLLGIDSSPKAGLILALVQAGDKNQIWTLKPDGSEARKLVEENYEIDSSRWSPAGDSIYYLRRTESTSELVKVSARGGHAEPSVLASGLQVGEDTISISADGSRLAYTRVNDNSNLWRVRLHAEGKGKPEISQLTSGTSYYGEASFSPDGRWLTFPLGSSLENTNIYKMQLSGGQPIQLTFFEHALAANPAWSPDSQHIAFVSRQNGSTKVWMVNANGGAAQPLERTNAADSNHRLSWFPSPEIVYQIPGVRNLSRINGKTQEEQLLIHDPSVGWLPFRPIFSPDGKNVAVNWNRHPDRGIWTISLEPYSETPLLANNGNGDNLPLGWSPDGKYVYSTQGREIVKVGIASPNQPVSVATLPGDVVDSLSGCMSPDGRGIVVPLSEAKSDVWIMENFDPALSRTTK